MPRPALVVLIATLCLLAVDIDAFQQAMDLRAHPHHLDRALGVGEDALGGGNASERVLGGGNASEQVIGGGNASEQVMLTENMSDVKLPFGGRNVSVVGGRVVLEACEKLGSDFVDEAEASLREERNFARLLTSSLPPFAVTSVEGVDEKCRNDSRAFLRELDRLTLWALRMHDSTAKPPSGWLNGNVNQFGDFDQCLSVSSGAADAGAVRGQYCLAGIDVTLRKDATRSLQQLHKLAQSHRAFRSTPDDPGHRVPRFSSFHWAVCVPDSCSANAVQRELQRRVASALAPIGVRVRVSLAPEMCHVAKWTLPTSTILAGLFFAAMLALSLVATATDGGPSKPSLLRCFSLRRNVAILVDTAHAPDELSAVHGLRAFNAVMLIICHKSMALFFNPYVNRTAMTEALGQPWTVVGRAASLYTDPFVMFSGLLTSYAYFRQFAARGAVDVRKEFASRLFRLVPNLAAVILFCTFLLPWLGSGPQWNQVVSHHAQLCQQHWWRNLVFVHNYFGFENMCLTHTHHLGIDTQLFVAAPALCYVLWRWPRGGATALAALALTSTWLRYSVTLDRELSIFVYFGSSVSQMFRSADLSYILPTHRLTVYVMGVFLGYALRRCGRQFPLNKLFVAAGWTLMSALVYVSLFAPARMGFPTYVYDARDAANYAAFAPITWCLVFAWVVFATHTGNGGPLGRLASWPGFKVATRLSYAVYLTQFPVFFYNVGRTRSAEFYTTGMLLNMPETTCILLASTILTLMFDLPFQNIRNMLLKKNAKPVAAEQNTIKSD